LAVEGLRTLQDRVDTLIVIPNQNLFRMVDKQTSVMSAFGLADDVLLAGVKSITDLMVRPGLINLDFADVQVKMPTSKSS
jgi:cell division protein FtsZ